MTPTYVLIAIVVLKLPFFIKIEDFPTKELCEASYKEVYKVFHRTEYSIVSGGCVTGPPKGRYQ